MIKVQPTSLLQIFPKVMINSKVILKSVKGPDDNCQGYLDGCYFGAIMWSVENSEN